MNTRCKNCKGEYDTKQQVHYAHTCPDGIIKGIGPARRFVTYKEQDKRDENPVLKQDNGQPFDQQRYFKENKKYKIRKEGKGVENV